MNYNALARLALAIVCCFAIGCDKKEAPGPTTEVKQSEKIAPKPAAEGAAPDKLEQPCEKGCCQKNRGHRKMRDPIMKLIHAALKQVELTEEQSAKLHALQKEPGDKERSAYRPVKIAFFQALAKAVESGQIDEDDFQEQLNGMEEVGKSKLLKRAKILTDLHGILEPKQRKAVADAARAMMKKFGESEATCPFATLGHKGCDCPHAEGGHKKGCDCPFFGHGHHKGKMLFKLVKDLEMTPEQKNKVDVLIEKAKVDRPTDEERKAKKEEMKKEVGAFFDAFEKDALDTGAIEQTSMCGRKKVDRLKAQISVLSELVKILGEEQRKQLSTRLQEKASRMEEERDN